MNGHTATNSPPDMTDVQTSDNKPYNVFLSYNSEERDSVEKIAVGLADTYGLDPWLDLWELVPGEPWLDALERGLTSAQGCAVFIGRTGKGPWQDREVVAALDRQTRNTGFRVIPVLLPGAGMPAEMPVFLKENTMVTFRDVTDDDALWKLKCGILGKAPGRGRPREGEKKSSASNPRPHIDPATLRHPGGAIDVCSRFYIKRKADETVFNSVNKHRGMVTVRGPRQTGKTSLLCRVYENLQHVKSNIRPVFVDFQSFTRENMSSQNALWCSIAEEIAGHLRIEDWQSGEWDDNGSYDRNISRFLDRYVFAENETPLLLCLDEVDRVFKSPVMSDFFSSVRAFWNRGARDPSWKKVRWLLSTSSEPGFFITDLSQSPFNIGSRVELGAFTPDEVEKFAKRHGLVPNNDMVSRIMRYVGGRPYLVHLLLYHLALNDRPVDQLFTASTEIFREHLSRFLKQFQQEPDLAKAMKRVVDDEGCRDLKTAERLQAGGLVTPDINRKVVCACDLYKEFFGREL